MPNAREKIMKSMTIATLLLAATITLALAQSPAEHEAHHPQQSAAPAPSQPAPSQTQQGMGSSQGMMGGAGMMNTMSGNMMQMMGSRECGMGGMGTIDRVEGRIAFLRTELKITDTQSAAWNAFADTLRNNAKSLGQVRASMMSQAGTAPQSLVDRLTLQEKWLAARLEGTRAMKSALTNLAGTLSDDQKKTADQLLAPHIGMNAMMGGMQSGQMGGQMQPGMMMQGQGR
jgi:LTXXQ motif family protein